MRKHNNPETKKLFLGPFHPNLECTLSREVESYKRAYGQLAPLSICVPSRLLAVSLRRMLAKKLSISTPGYTGHANIQFMTLKDLAEHLTRHTPVRLAPKIGLEMLCAQIIREELPKDGYFGALRKTKGFPPALLETFTDLHEADVIADTLHLIAKQTGSNKLSELANTYATFREWLRKNQFGLESDLFETATRVRGLESAGPLLFYGFYDLNLKQRRFAESVTPDSWFVPWPKKNTEFANPLRKWLTNLGYQEQPISIRKTQTPPPVVSIVSAPGETVEVCEAIREIFSYVQETGKTFNDTAVLYRSSAQYEAILRDTLNSCHIPAYFQGGRPCIEKKDARLILLIFEAIRTGFSRRSVMELACFTGANSHWDRLSVNLQIVGGKEQWLRRISNVASKSSETSHTEQAIAIELLQYLKKLFGLIGDMPQSASWDLYVDVTLKVFHFHEGQDTEVIDHLLRLKDLKPFQDTVDFETFSNVCQKQLQITSSQQETFQGGNVFVGDVMGARGMSWPLVIVLGLVEKSFPRIIREDPLLLDDERAVISSSLPLKHRGHEEERFLFELTTSAASEKLIVSYPRIDSESASPRVPSYLLLDFTGNRNFKKLEEEVVSIPLSPIRHVDTYISENEFDVATLVELRGAKEYLAAISPLLTYGVIADQARWTNRSLTSYDGLILGSSALQELHSQIGGDVINISTTALERFFQCPFFYFLKNIIRTESWEEPSNNLQIIPKDLGLLYHAILESYFRSGGNISLTETAETEFAEFEKQEVAAHPTIWEMQKQIIVDELQSFLSRDQVESKTEWLPLMFEKEFRDVQLSGGFRLRGKIDRIDIHQNGKVARLVDYKTGKLPEKLRDNVLNGGQALQLPLYMLAGQSLLPVQQFTAAHYAYITLRGRYRTITFDITALRNRMQDIEILLKTASAMMRSGVFAQYATKDHCPHCEYKPICGSGILQLYANKGTDPQMAEYRNIKESIK